MNVTSLILRSHFAVLDPSSQTDYSSWLQLWEAWPNREIFAHPDYVRLFGREVGVAKCAVLTTPRSTVIYPFILRTIGDVRADQQIQKDIVSPYGYGGCFAWGAEDRCTLQAAFYGWFDEWLNESRIVSEFVRLSLFGEECLSFPGVTRKRSLNVIRSLDAEENDIWRDYEAKVRKNVQKARRNNVHITIDEHGDDLESFYRIYTGTMDRREAAAAYRFSPAFLQEFNTALAGNYAYASAIYRDEVVSTELVLVSSRSVYSFLGGTDHSSFDVRPNDLLKHEIVMWAKSRGKQHFVLGGGYQSGDGIYRYKKAFAPSGIVPFRTGERILDPAAYECLVALRKGAVEDAGQAWDPDLAFFPRYRA